MAALPFVPDLKYGNPGLWMTPVVFSPIPRTGWFSNHRAVLSETGRHLRDRMTNDPPAIDLERLDGFLSSEDSPEDFMTLSDLDGFLHGITCTAETISSQEWMPVALGGPLEAIPAWVLKDVALLYTDIRHGLLSEPPEVEPIFWQAGEGHLIAMDWCEGFMNAVNLRADKWQVCSDTAEGSQLMAPILAHMFDENGNSLLGLPQEAVDETLEQAAAAIPMVVAAIFRLTAAAIAPQQ